MESEVKYQLGAGTRVETKRDLIGPYSHVGYGQAQNAARRQEESRFAIYLGIIFILSFAVPVLLTFRFGSSISESLSAKTPAELFPAAFNISGPGVHLNISGSALEPAASQDFLFTGWYQFRELPNPGEEVLLFSKSDPDSPSRRGYSLSISRDSDSFRPVVQWRDAQGKGGSYSFSEMKIVPRSWVMIALNYSQGRYLAMFYSTVLGHGERNVELLGGYEVPGIFPSADNSLKIGSFAKGKFRGRVGTVGIFSMPEISDLKKEVLRSLVNAPLEVPAYFPKDAVKLWIADGKTDSGAFKHEVQFKGFNRSSAKADPEK